MIIEKLNPMLLCDFYKISHREQYPKGTEVIYSTWTPRQSRIEGVNKVVAFGIQAFIKNYLIDYFDKYFFQKPIDQILADYKDVIQKSLGLIDIDTSHIEELHALQYLPFKIKAIAEGTQVPVRVPMLTIENTIPKFYWLTNYIETLMSCELWQPMTSATIARRFRDMLDKYAFKTVQKADYLDYCSHDFSMRGMSSLSSAMSSGAGHLLSFKGTDSIPAIQYLNTFYGSSTGASIAATEHSVQCAYNFDSIYLKNMLDLYKDRPFSIVCDGYDFWSFLVDILPLFRDTIEKRSCPIVIRPDSGDPVKIICGDEESDNQWIRKGAIKTLLYLFGGETNDKGYIVLKPYIRLIYGDAITFERCEEICSRLAKKGFSIENVVFGVGSYTYQYNTRDTFGFALKSTYCKINGEHKHIYKDPKTDDGTKKSLKGKVRVYRENGKLKVEDGLDDDKDSLLETVFEDGKLIKEFNYHEVIINSSN